MRKSRRIKAKKDAEVANGDEEAAAAGGDGDNDAPVENGEDGKLALCPVFVSLLDPKQGQQYGFTVD